MAHTALAALGFADPSCLARDGRVVTTRSGPPLGAPRPDDPIVLDPHLVATGVGPLAGLHLEADDLTAVDGPGTPLLVRGGTVVARRDPAGGAAAVVGSVAWLADHWLATADNAAILARLVGADEAEVRRLVARHRPAQPAHRPLPVLDTDGWVDLPANPGHARRLLPPAVHDALVDLADGVAGADGALLLRGVPRRERVLLAVARCLGHPVGFAPEHGGDLVQDLVPTPAGAHRQTSTSSAVELEFHTETAFHPHKPRYLLLLCMRGDPAAVTYLCGIDDLLPHLSLGARAVLAQPRFRTGADESFGGTGRRGRRLAVLSGDPERPTLTYDADLMEGTDPEAQAALDELGARAQALRLGLVLGAGDLLVVDNHRCIHGRGPFPARYDGTDRWLKRTFVVSDLAASAGERAGGVITTRFA